MLWIPRALRKEWTWLSTGPAVKNIRMNDHATAAEHAAPDYEHEPYNMT